MDKIDLSYLDRYVGANVEVLMQLNPDFNNRRETELHLGKLFPENSMGGIKLGTNLHLPEHQRGKLVSETPFGCTKPTFQWSTQPCLGSAHLPYIGVTESVWRIRMLSNGHKLLSHVRIGEGDYLVLNDKQQELGLIRGLALPYKTSYDPWDEEATKLFVAWRDRAIQPVTSLR